MDFPPELPGPLFEDGPFAPGRTPEESDPRVVIPCSAGKGEVTAEQLRAQAERFGAVRTVWPHARTPLAGTRGIGHQRARLAEIIRTSTLPTTTHEATAV